MKKILIIEDDSVIASIYGTKLALAGYEVQTATDGAKGLKLVQSFKPDLVQIDLMLPEVSGVDVISHIRSQPEFKSIPIIVLSNFYVTHLIQAAWKAGATKCLTKVECTPKGMVEIVREALATATPSPAPAQAAPATPPLSPAAKSPPRLLEADVDTTFQAEIRRAFLERAPQLLATLRRRLHGINRPETDPARQPELFEFCRTVHSLAGNATIAGFNQITDMAGALEALLKELYDKPKHITASSLRTIAHTVDFLGVLFEHSSKAQPKTAAPAMVLVVDDEIISRQAVGLALAKANLAFISVDDSQIALKLLQENRFNLIFLDVDMPGLNGFELCHQLRALPANQGTPVVFVTSLADFESRARSALSGGNDLIAKPFLLMELAVKALSYVLKQQMRFFRKVPVWK